MIIAVVYIYTILTTVIMVLMENRNPVKSIAWIVVLILVPVVGFIFYIFFGKNLRKQFVVSRRSLQKLGGYSYSVEDIRRVSSDILPEEHRNLATLVMNSCDAEAYPNNDVRLYSDGAALFEDILADLETATHHIHLEYYIFLADKIGRRVIDTLLRKVRQGVSVRVIIDDVGSWQMKKSAVAEMRAAGIRVECFLKVGLPFLSSKVNYRNHRKILVVDGRVGYTGGMNIADRYVDGLKWGPWRDSHLRIEGAGVAGLQRTFLSDWYFVDRRLISDPNFFPLPEAKGRTLLQMVTSGPDTAWNSILQMCFTAIVQARTYIYIETPYFLPNDSIVTALQNAALSGTDVQIILPERADANFTLTGSHSYLGDMFKAGVKIHFYKGGFIHSKTIVIDDKISTVGTANMDMRSFEQNFEANVLMYDPEIAVRMREVFLEDKANSEEVDRAKWEKRPVLKRVKESVARLFSPVL